MLQGVTVLAGPTTGLDEVMLVVPPAVLPPPVLLADLLVPLVKPEAAMAGEFIEVESNSVIAGGTTTANLPAAARKARRSVVSALGTVLSFSMKYSINARFLTSATLALAFAQHQVSVQAQV